MTAQPNTNAFFQSVTGYEQFMGRYARPLAKKFVNSIPLNGEDAVLDIGCGPGALTAELVAKLGAGSVSVIDPSPPFLEFCAQQYPGIHAHVARAEDIPFGDNSFDAVMSQLVIHFIGDLPQAGREIMRVIKPGGWVAVCTWNLDKMEMIHLLLRAAQGAGIEVPPLRAEAFNEEGAVNGYLESIGLREVQKSTIDVTSSYADFDELWSSYLLSIGPLGPWTVDQSDDVKMAIRQSMFRILDEPDGDISLNAEARVATGRAPA